MKQLRAIRILLAVLFFTACTVCLVIGPEVHPIARAASKFQIVLSASSVTLGVTLVWIGLTFVFGRVYCASFCPVGVFSDIFFRIRKHIPSLRKPFSYRHPSKASYHILWIYILCLITGVTVVPLLVEPWNIARNMAAAANPSAISTTWATIALGSATGIAAGLLSALLIAITSLRYGREFCSRYCPLGTALGFLQDFSALHIEIDPDKCTSCGKCEENCRTQGIKVVSRYVDQRRCVRCLDCVADCPEGAIRFQRSRNRPASPLMRKVKKSAR